jgi:hypothetical protein
MHGSREEKIAIGEILKAKDKEREERETARDTVAVPAADASLPAVAVTATPIIIAPTTTPRTNTVTPVATTITPAPTPTTAPASVVGNAVTFTSPIKAQGPSVESAPKVPSMESRPKVPLMESTPKVSATVEGKKEEGMKVEGEKGLKATVEHVLSAGSSSYGEALHTPSFLPMIVCSTLVLFLSIMCAFWLR